ncbi:MAG: MBL fold metallo-hydrolase [Bacilli bacterium]|nr:MBL fold metallo-hydrolase [Bacilli bacterium]
MIEINTQSSIKIDNIYFDPFKIEKESHDANLIFITHAHYDHFDLDSIEKIAKDDTIIITPDDEEITKYLNGYEVFKVLPNQEYQVRDITFKTVPAYNTNKPFHKKEYGWVGYVLHLDQIYYIMGDTDDTVEARNIKCDYLFIPIGGTYTMNYEEAAIFTNDTKPKTVTPIHYGSIVGEKDNGIKFKKLIDKRIKVEILLNNV